MNHAYTHCRESGIPWVLAFIIIATITISTCIKQEKLIAEKSPIIVAMRSNSL